MKPSRLGFLFVLAIGAATATASCSVDEAGAGDISKTLDTFHSDGFAKVNGDPLLTHAGYSTSHVNVWVNDAAVDLYRSLPGTDQLVEPTWATPAADPPKQSFPAGTILIREDLDSGELAIMERFDEDAASGELSWRWLKRDAAGLHYGGEECWSCHGSFAAGDGAIGVAADQR